MQANYPILSALNVGDKLPILDIPITATQIVAGALASQDFEDVHHDKAAANGKGTPDIFMNILTSNGIVGRYLTDWAGPASRIKRIKLSLGVPNFPGDSMRLSGSVSEITDALVTIEFKGKNSLGNHLSGSAQVNFANLGNHAISNHATSNQEAAINHDETAK